MRTLLGARLRPVPRLPVSAQRLQAEEARAMKVQRCPGCHKRIEPPQTFEDHAECIEQYQASKSRELEPDLEPKEPR